MKDPFQRDVERGELEKYALSVGFKQFKSRIRAYERSLKLAVVDYSAVPEEDENSTQFEEQVFELDTGIWTADDTGVWKRENGERRYACTHPIMPIERLKNIDTGELKMRLAFRRGAFNRKTWTEILTGFDTISNSKNIVNLAQIGISVTSGERAQNLVDYISSVMDRNYDLIPERKSVCRMGWNEEGFTPYTDEVVFDGNAGFERHFKAISCVGKYEKWLEEALDARKYSLTARIVLASSFASVLIGPLGCLPFFVHLWGMDSGTGKSVAQMLAAAVWGDPYIGNPFFPTFKATTVGFEILAGFFNSLPIFVDELQLTKDAKGRIVFNVYELAAGAGKLRSNKALGLASTPTWANCFITSGETPITSESDGAGAINRVIEIECRAGNKAIENGHRTANAVKENYGHAGKTFVSKLVEPGNLDRAKALYEKHFTECAKNDTTEKQAMAAAIILTADAMATEWIFKDGNALTVSEMSEFLKSKEAVSAAQRGYDYICDWVALNANKFRRDIDQGEIFGLVEDGWAYIIRSVFNKACSDSGINAKALLSHMRSRDLIQTKGKALTKSKRIPGIDSPVECVVMKLREDAEALLPNENSEELL